MIAKALASFVTRDLEILIYLSHFEGPSLSVVSFNVLLCISIVIRSTQDAFFKGILTSRPAISTLHVRSK